MYKSGLRNLWVVMATFVRLRSCNNSNQLVSNKSGVFSLVNCSKLMRFRKLAGVCRYLLEDMNKICIYLLNLKFVRLNM